MIELVADGDILLKRFIQRSELGERHPGHVDQTTYGEAVKTFCGEKPLPFDLGGRYIEVDTSDFSKVDPNALVSAIRAEMEGPI